MGSNYEHIVSSPFYKTYPIDSGEWGLKRMKKMVVILCIIVLGIALLVIPVAAQSCGEESLDDACGCNICAATPLNLQVTPTCDGLDLTWNDIGATGYLVAYYDPIQNQWHELSFISGTSFSIPKANMPPGTYSLAVLPYDIQSGWICYSNIVCDVKLPTTCTDTPEFPSVFLPATMIIGFVGAVLLIQRTKEH